MATEREVDKGEDWWTHSKLRAHISKLYIEANQPKYYVNTGYGGEKDYYYSERMIELPFLFRNVAPPPKSLLDIGCVESVVPIQLSMLGYDVTGIDIREYHFKHKNFKFIKDDFNLHEFSNKFDIIVDISAIEHFGLHTFSNLELDFDADKKAIKKVYSLLKPKGQFIFTAPFGVSELVGSFERIYSNEDIKSMFSDFKVVNKQYFHVQGSKLISEVDLDKASKLKYQNGNYGTVCINAVKRSRD